MTEQTPDYLLVPKHLKTAITLIWNESLDEKELMVKSDYIASLSILLKLAVVKSYNGNYADAKNICDNLNKMNVLLSSIVCEYDKENLSDYSNFFKISNETLDYCTSLIFKGYGNLEILNPEYKKLLVDDVS